MKKIKSVIIGILLIASILAVINPVSAATREVGSGKTYATIGAAMAAAVDGDNILVYPGTYNEYVNITVRNITLKSVAGRDSTIIGPGTNNIVIRINKNLGLITVDGFTVLVSATSPTTGGNGIIQAFYEGPGTTCYILNNKIKSQTPPFKNAIQVIGENSKVIGNIVEGASLEDPDWGGTGIFIMGPNMIIKDNYISNTDYGIGITEDTRIAPLLPSNTIVENNTIENCPVVGLYIRGNVTNSLIRYNTIWNNIKWGVLERHNFNYYNTGSACNTILNYNTICNNGINIEVRNEGYDPNYIENCTLDARYNWWCTNAGPPGGSLIGAINYYPWEKRGDLPMKKFQAILNIKNINQDE